ncbi:biliverdin-producing heme oxygenase [Hellea sp.]|nr:biliverdin-producing heme oxygenase [Hellea sp.]
MTIPPISDSGLPLVDFLKESTWALHTEAEKTGVVADIIRQRVVMKDYLNFIQNLSEVYKALESETDWLGDYAPLQDFFTPALHRHKQLEHDYKKLRALNSAIPSGEIHDETRNYCKHIRHSQKHVPVAMLAHIYVRYLGDLNGGQVLQRLLKSSLDLSDDCLSFYAFPGISDITQFRLNFRETLNRTIVTEAELQSTKQAAMDAFKFNIALSMACQS